MTNTGYINADKAFTDANSVRQQMSKNGESPSRGQSRGHSVERQTNKSKVVARKKAEEDII